MGNWVKNRLLPSGSSSVVVPSGSTIDRPETPVFGQFRYNIDLASLEFYNGTQFVAVATSGGITYTVDTFVGNGSQTVFTMSQEEGSVTQIMVFVGSVYQDPYTAYTVDGGYDITFTSAPPIGMTVNVIHSTS